MLQCFVFACFGVSILHALVFCLCTLWRFVLCTLWRFSLFACLGVLNPSHALALGLLACFSIHSLHAFGLLNLEARYS
jgi:hypothetical protein